MASVYNWLRERPALIGFLILTVGVVIAIASSADSVKRDVALNSCERVNLLRAQSNVSNDVSWSVLSVSAQREAKLAAAGPNAKLHQQSVRLLAQQAERLDVTPLTDCDAAVSVDHEHPYFFAGARRIGNPVTGQKDPVSQATVDASEKLIADVPRSPR